MKKLLTGAIMAMAISQALAAPDPNFHIYLAFGQSNMEGQGGIESQDRTVDSRFQVMWTANNGSCAGNRSSGNWYDATPPLASCNGKLGPADYFGRTMVEKTDPQIKVGVIVVAVAGCSIKLFDKDSYKSVTGGDSWYTSRVNDYGGNPYGRLIEMATKAKQAGVIKGIIFHQGETDAGDGQWPSKVKRVYDNIIKQLELEDDDIPLLAGEVLRTGVSKGANNNIAKLPQQSRNFYVISSEGLTQPLNDGQNVHFTSQEYRDLGKRYAEKMIEVLGDKLKPVAESSSSVAESSSSEEASSSSVTSSASIASSSSTAPESSSNASTGFAQTEQFAGGSLSVNKAGNVVLSLAKAEQITVKVYSSLGKEVLDLSGNYSGTNSLVLAGRLPAGRYVVSAQGAGFKAVKPVMVK